MKASHDIVHEIASALSPDRRSRPKLLGGNLVLTGDRPPYSNESRTRRMTNA